MASDENLNRRFYAGDLPESYEVGERLRASTVNTLMDAVRQLARTGNGLGVETPLERPQLIFAQNVSGADIGPWQMVEITGSALYNPVKAIIVNSPSAASVELTAITSQPIANWACGWVYTCGVALIEYTGAAAIGDRLGSQNGNTIAIADGTSAWVVIGTTIIAAVTYALVRFQPAGGGGNPEMLIAKENMIADDVAYDCNYLEADGTTGANISARRPNGIAVADSDIGFLGLDSSGQNMFIPANMREAATMPISIETRTDDPATPVAGRFWLRTDLL